MCHMDAIGSIMFSPAHMRSKMGPILFFASVTARLGKSAKTIPVGRA